MLCLSLKLRTPPPFWLSLFRTQCKLYTITVCFRGARSPTESSLSIQITSNSFTRSINDTQKPLIFQTLPCTSRIAVSPVTHLILLHGRIFQLRMTLSVIFNWRNSSSLSSPDSDSGWLFPYLTAWTENSKRCRALRSYTRQSENTTGNSMHHITCSSPEAISLRVLAIHFIWLGLSLSCRSSLALLKLWLSLLRFVHGHLLHDSNISFHQTHQYGPTLRPNFYISVPY